MGRIFETRKHKIFARMDKMAKAFTKIGKEIAMAVKQGGGDPHNNPRLRVAIQNAKAVNMPKDRVDAAIKRAVSKDESNYEEAVYEGYGPNGVAILIEAATDNPTRTIANIRLIFSKAGGAVGKSGSLDFLFTRKCVFQIDPAGLNMDDLELALIDMGADDIQVEEGVVIAYAPFTNFGTMQKALEEGNFKVISSQLERIPNTFVETTEEQTDEILKMVEKLEEDDDVQNVFHNLK